MAATPIVPPKPFGASRAGSQPVRVFQPPAPSASGAAAAVPDPAATPRAADSSDDANAPAGFPLPGAAADTTPAALISGQSAATANGTATKGKMSNPYAELPGKKVKGTAAPRGEAAAAQHSTAPLTPLLTSAQQQQQPVFSSSAAVAVPITGGHRAAAALQHSVSGPTASSTDDLVTTYTSFSHDPINPYAAFGAGPTMSYTDSGRLIDAFDSSAAVVAAHDVPHGDGNQMSNNFDDMTELQL